MIDVDAVVLKFGSHESASDGFCAMELVAYMAKEKHSDKPECACPVISSFLRSWNDGLDEEPRNRLIKPMLSRVVGSRSTPETERIRSMMVLDWLLRECTPAWLDLVPVASFLFLQGRC